MAVDVWGMRTLLFWLLVSASVSAGFVVARGSGIEPTFAAEVISAAVLFGFAGLLWGAGVGRRAPAALGFAVVCFAAARGMHGGGARDASFLAAQRGPPPRTRALYVVASSVPGPVCTVVVRSDAGQPIRAALPAQLCPLARGDLVHVLSSELVPSQAPEQRRPDTPVLFRRAWLGGGGRAGALPCKQRSLWALPRGARAGTELASCMLARVRTAAAEAAYGDRGRGLVVATTLGLTRSLSRTDRAHLRRAGLGHLIAISGLHLGVGGLLLQRALRWLMGTWTYGVLWSMVGAAIPLVGFVVLTGAGAPAIRAGLMLALCTVGQWRGRPTHRKTVLAVAVAVMLVYQPGWLLAPGFQLSIVAMLVLLGLPRDASLLQTSWQLSWAVLPLIWVHFRGTADGSVVANAFALPMFGYCILPAAAVGWTLVPWLGSLALAPAGWGGEVVMAGAEWIASWPTLWRGWWVLLGLLSFLPWRRHRWGRQARRWLPPRVVVFALAGIWVQGELAQREPQWRAWGAQRRTNVVRIGERNVAAVRMGSGGTATPLAVLDALEPSGVVGIADDARASVLDPHRMALSRAFEQRGWLSNLRGQATLRLPERSEVSRAVRRCASFSSPPHVRVVGQRTSAAARSAAPGSLECWSHVSQTWRALPP